MGFPVNGNRPCGNGQPCPNKSPCACRVAVEKEIARGTATWLNEEQEMPKWKEPTEEEVTDHV